MDLYKDLPEAEANQMIALLILRQIDADKQPAKGGQVTVRVDKTQFVNAVEWLRQNGLPSKTVATMNDLFPSGQLVTSPAQEQAKITYLKEQQLEKMLRSIEGVVYAQVSIAQNSSQNRHETPTLAASVFIQYSPEHNLNNREISIIGLIKNGVPNLQAENISLVLQPTDYRYLPSQPSGFLAWLGRSRLWLTGLLIVAAGIYLRPYLRSYLKRIRA
ncbi:type III secretion bridge between inner and outermembrane lipoprotein [bacterium endosymbiont of Mortierella elongata FMR23-6]|nr:type III secretion bridge between inner and outermembrane lipoprotein [bacterium endosymbiont of Mortierella elongata FMR23-6]